MREATPLIVTLLVLVGLFVLGSLAMAVAGGPMMGPGVMWGFGGQPGVPPIGGWSALMGLGWLMMLAFWGALILGVVLLVRWLAGGTPARANTEDPLTVLQRRYALGEIDEETYRHMRREIDPGTTTVDAQEGIRRVS